VGKIKPSDAIWLLANHDGLCGICTQPIDQDQPREIDHRIPISAGGTHHRSNLQVAHRSCNRSKGQRLVCE
jgi:5-methylcytosine-specific restriction endonuclease McrA